MQAAQRILDQGGWCLYECCIDVPRQLWEARLVIFDLSAEAVANAIEAEIELEPEHDARLTGCDRRTLCPDPGMGAYLCYVTDERAGSPRNGSSGALRSTLGPRSPMLVRDGANPTEASKLRGSADG
jgi:hypothetical protein